MEMEMEIALSVVVPCYNEEKVLPIFYEKIAKILNDMCETYEIVFVDDGSRDSTLRLLKDFASEDSHVVYLSFSRNFGKEAAIYAGLLNAHGSYIVVMDADMQDPPELLSEMYDLIRKGDYDCVATRRVSRNGEPHIRSFFARMFYRIINKISDAEIMDGARDFRIMKSNMVEAILNMEEYNRFSKGIFGWIGFKTCWIDYENVERAAGETKWNFWGLFRYAIEGIISFSQTPLTIMAITGVIISIIAFLATIFLVVRRICFGDPVQGWASTMCVIILLSGIQVFFMGIVGQYVARIYMEVKNRPHFIISETNSEHAKKIG